MLNKHKLKAKLPRESLLTLHMGSWLYISYILLWKSGCIASSHFVDVLNKCWMRKRLQDKAWVIKLHCWQPTPVGRWHLQISIYHLSAAFDDSVQSLRFASLWQEGREVAQTTGHLGVTRWSQSGYSSADTGVQLNQKRHANTVEVWL